MNKSKVEELETITRDTILAFLEEARTNGDTEAVKELERFDAECVETFGDDYTEYGEPLISEYYFEQYAEDLLFEMYAIPIQVAPYVDGYKFADDLRYDYTEVVLFGIIFFGR